MEHCLRQTVIALRIADRIGVVERDRVATYYTGLLANVYCHADAHEQAEWFGDDIVVKHGAYEPHVFEFLRMIGASERGLARARKMASFPGQGVALLKSMYDTHTRLASQFAARIGLDDVTCRALRETYEQWHGQRDLRGVDAVVLPGGFSYGDYLRCGAIARFAPVMAELVPAARAGLPVLGICNGFQILCEAHVLPGALTRNSGLRFISREVRVRMENAATPWTAGYAPGQEVTLVLKSGEGAYVADSATLSGLEARGQVLARYVGASPNGSASGIAGICSESGSVVGLMPHPEHAVDPLTGPDDDGLGFFTSAVRALAPT